MSFVYSFSQGNLNYRGENISKGIIKKNNEIKGENFIYDEWNQGMLVLNDSVFSNQEFLKYDAYKDLVLIKKGDKIIEISDKSITGFSIFEKENNLKHDFVGLKGNHFLDKSEKGFYEIVDNSNETNYFIKKNEKFIFDPNRNSSTMAVNNFQLEYKDKVSYYIKNNDGLYVKVRLNKKGVKSVLLNNSPEINKYIKIHKIRFNKEDDVMKLVNYYYSI